MANFLQQVVSGLASGGIYGSLALALVLIHRATGVLNFAQGEMATLSAFCCWSLIDHGWAFWPAFGATILLSFAGGIVLEQTVIRPIEGGPLLGIVILTIGLLIAGQLAMGVLIDRYGWFGVEQVPLSWPRVLGVLLLAVGALLALRR